MFEKQIRIQICVCLSADWRRPIGCLKLQVIFRKRATNFRALLHKWPIQIKHPVRLRHPVPLAEGEIQQCLFTCIQISVCVEQIKVSVLLQECLSTTQTYILKPYTRSCEINILTPYTRSCETNIFTPYTRSCESYIRTPYTHSCETNVLTRYTHSY